MRIALLRPGGNEPFPAVERALREPNGLLAAGGDLSTERLLQAYRFGIFPWYSAGEPILWWSPDPRMVFATAAMHRPRRLARWLRQCPWTLHADCRFEQVLHDCAAPRATQSGTWITPTMHEAYLRLHHLGHAHSIEVCDGEAMVGGIYGVAIGQMFYGESMFSRASNGSKVALLALARLLQRWRWPLIDAQVSSEHLQTLGALQMARHEFSVQIAQLTARPGEIGNWSHHLDGISAREWLAI